MKILSMSPNPAQLQNAVNNNEPLETFPDLYDEIVFLETFGVMRGGKSTKNIISSTVIQEQSTIYDDFLRPLDPANQNKCDNVPESREKISSTRVPSEKRVHVNKTALKPLKRLNSRKQAKPNKIQEIRHIIPRKEFSSCVRAEMKNLKKGSQWRFTSASLKLLQESTEMYLTQLFEDAYLCTTHRKRTTLEVKDIDLARQLRVSAEPTK